MAKLTQSTPSIMRSKVGAALITGTAGGLVTLLDPAKFPVGLQRSLCLGTGALGGLAAWFGTGANTDTKPGVPVRLFVATGLGGMLAAGTKLGFVVDSAIHHSLLRRGVTRPRMVMAISAAVLATAAALLESTTQDDADDAAGPAMVDAAA